ncbi:hypothetical protein TNCV_921641 [Trichonephila clavipes]|nr:hypothetical protein TNCV_921641 [Trichonephila clavipes]
MGFRRIAPPIEECNQINATERWTEVLPIILLGFRASLKKIFLKSFWNILQNAGEICKPAFFLNTEDLQLLQTKNEIPATVEPNDSFTQPATVESEKLQRHPAIYTFWSQSSSSN